MLISVFPTEVGGLVALLYDHVLTLDQEIRLIWKAPNTFVKWMFLVTRYLSEACLLALANGAHIDFPCILFPQVLKLYNQKCQGSTIRTMT